MSAPTIRVLIVDDTALYRKILTDAASQVPGLEVAASVGSGPAALKRLAIEPIDLVLLDVFMPEMNGPEVLARIRRDHPRIAVVMISGATGTDAAITMDALANGALDFIPKPQTASFADGMARLSTQLKQVVRLVQIRRITSSAPAPTLRAGTVPSAVISDLKAQVPATLPAEAPGIPRRRGSPPPAMDILLIGVSTGGPRTLQEILPRIPADFRLPIVMVQHMPALFTRTLAEQLDKVCPLRVAEAAEGDLVKPGQIMVN